MSAACKPLSCWLFSLGFSTFKAEEQKPNPFRSCKKPHLPALLGQGCGSGLQHVHGGACSARPAAGAAETPCGRTRQHEPRGPWARGGRLSAAGPAPASKTPELPGCLPSPAQRHPPPGSALGSGCTWPVQAAGRRPGPRLERRWRHVAATLRAYRLPTSASWRPGATRRKRLLKSFTRMACKRAEARKVSEAHKSLLRSSKRFS